MTKTDLISFAVSRIGVSPSNDLPELRKITEDRCFERPGGRQYAWCGDFATYCLMCCGCQDGGALNRVALNGKWTPGDNIARLVRWAKGHQQFCDLDQVEPGDIIIFANTTGDHICFAESILDGSGNYTTIDGNSGNIVARNRRVKGNKPIRCCINTAMLIQQHVAPMPGEKMPFPMPPVDLIPAEWTTVPFPVGMYYDTNGSVLAKDSDPKMSSNDLQYELDQYLCRLTGGPSQIDKLEDLRSEMNSLPLSDLTIRAVVQIAQFFCPPRIHTDTDSITLNEQIVDTQSEHAYLERV